MLQCDAVRCSVLQCVAAHLKCQDVVRVKCGNEGLPFSYVAVCCSVLQCVTSHLKCHDLLRVKSAPFGVLQCVAAYCSALQRVAMCCIATPEVP